MAAPAEAGTQAHRLIAANACTGSVTSSKPRINKRLNEIIMGSSLMDVCILCQA